MDESAIVVRRATLKEIFALRHAVLRAGLPETANFPGDERETSIHAGAFAAGEVVGCVTLHVTEWEGKPAWQLRGMAVRADARGAGVGRKLIRFLEVETAGDERVWWCNAREGAVGFYEATGWRVASDRFEVPTAGAHFRMVKG